MYSKSSFNYLYKSINTSILNKNILIIVILLSSIFICHLCINESFTVSKTIYLDTYFFKTEQEKKDGLMFIHPDSKQARSITVREAAILQSFPEDFEFVGSMGSCYKMIGNAVPPKMAENIAIGIANVLLS